MDLQLAKEEFIAEWGNLCMNWGVNRTMGQIHGLLLTADNPMCADELMKKLEMSRGNVNMNVRALIDWGIVTKVLIKGERKEFFQAEKDIWRAFRAIIKQRKKKELDPMIELLERMSTIKPQCSESQEFCKVVDQLTLFGEKADNAMNTIINSDSNWLTKTFKHLMR